MEAYLLDWVNLLLRWLHFIAGVAWIGASFYFVMLDSSLQKPKRPRDVERGVAGELWAVHGGGLYNSQKYLVGPVGEPLAEKLHWSKWEAYTTWLSGMGLLALIYWFGASTYLVDAQVMALSVGAGIAISVAVLAGGWVVYDALCRMLRGRDGVLALIYWFGASTYLVDAQVMALSVGAGIAISVAVLAGGWVVYDALCRMLRGRDGVLAAIIFALVAVSAWGLFQVFGARAAYLHVGAMMGTIMVANVFFHIIPGQKRMVAQMRAGEPPDAEPGIIGKQRSVHNTYFTLPVLFVMISNHYPMTYSHPQGWLVLIFIMLAGVLIRQYFVMRHSSRAPLALPAIAVILLLAMVWYLRPAAVDTGAARVGDDEIALIMQARCIACHAAKPSQPGFAEAPLGIVLETPAQWRQYAERVAISVQTRYMPIGNLTGMTDEERAVIATWYAQLGAE